MTAKHRLLYIPLRLLQHGSGSRRGDPVALQELAASIRQVGILQPLTVRKSGGQYMVVSGGRRLTAARMAGLGEAPCILMELEGQDAALIALTENLQREDLHYFEEAELLREYLMRSGLSQSQAARRLGRSQSAVANKLRLLGHTPPVRQRLRERGLSERHARELLRVKGETKRLAVLEELAGRHLSVAQTERFITAYLANGAGDGEERLRRRDTRLFLARIVRDAETLSRTGVTAELDRREEAGEIVVTLRIGKQADCEAEDCLV